MVLKNGWQVRQGLEVLMKVLLYFALTTVFLSFLMMVLGRVTMAIFM